MNSTQIINFLSHHWLLTTAFVVTLVALAINEARGRANSTAISPEQLVHSINHDNAIVLDLRHNETFATRNIVGSINVANITQELKKLQKYQNKPVIVVDLNGQHVAKAVKLLNENNFINVKSLAGGIAAWQQAGLPLTTAKKSSKAAKKITTKDKPKPQAKNKETTAKVKIVIYSKNTCPYCDRAKDLFKTKNVSYEEIMVDNDSGKLKEMLDRSKRRTVPQIFINDYHVGGFDDLAELQHQGKLDLLLTGKKI